MTINMLRRHEISSSSPRRDSDMSSHLMPLPSGKALQYFLVLPPSILDLICEHLDANDVKNLSLTCFGILDKIELTRELCPKIRILNVKPIRQIHPSPRILHTSITDTVSSPMIQPYLEPESDSPPEYSQLSRAAYHNAFRTHRTGTPFTVQTWLCPHVGCTANEAFLLRKHNKICGDQVRDTTPAVCPFPKCSLWARHALVESTGDEMLFELSSAIKVCRFSCRDLSSARAVLTNDRNTSIFRRAMRQLYLPICSHRLLNDDRVTGSFNPNTTSILDGHVNSTDSETLYQLENDIDRSRCDDCVAAGTYTTWGFTSRFVSEANGSWLDVEMVLCRPLYSADSVTSPKGVHWRHHSTRFPQTPEFVESWWKWAEVVAEGGFDWRARLPAQFLLRSQGHLTEFPSRPPQYADLGGVATPGHKAKAGSSVLTRRRPRLLFGIA